MVSDLSQRWLKTRALRLADPSGSYKGSVLWEKQSIRAVSHIEPLSGISAKVRVFVKGDSPQSDRVRGLRNKIGEKSRKMLQSPYLPISPHGPHSQS